MSCAIAAGLWIGGCQSAPAPETAATSAPPPAAAVTKKTPTDLEQLAERLVNQSAGIKEGEPGQLKI